MDLFQIIDDIAQTDPEVYDRFDSRRAAFRNFLGFGKKVSAAALPLAVSTLFNKAYGQAGGLPQAVTDTLNLALQLEYLEFYFYDTALNSPALGLSPEETRAFQIILNDERLHIVTLRNTLGKSVFGSLKREDFDYTGSQNMAPGRTALFPSLGGTIAPTSGLFTDKAVFLMVAQNFVDTGVRAYKGGAPSLNTTATKDILEAALNIHSVEARHSARIRQLRRLSLNAALPKSWITPDETSATPPLPDGGTQAPNAVGPYNAGNPAASFPAESNVMQGTTPVSVQTLTTVASPTAGAEAFDEPLDAATVKAIAKNFAASPTMLFV